MGGQVLVLGKERALVQALGQAPVLVLELELGREWEPQKTVQGWVPEKVLGLGLERGPQVGRARRTARRREDQLFLRRERHWLAQ